MSKTPAKSSTRPRVKGWSSATSAAARQVIASPVMVSWLGVIGSLCARAIARIARRLTQAWNRVVNTLFLPVVAVGIELRKRGLVDLDNLVHHAIPGVGGGAGAAFSAEARAERRVIRQQVDRRGQADRVVAAHQDAVAPGADDLGEAGNVGGDHGQAGRHRLQQDDPKALLAGVGGAEDVGAGVVARKGI